MAANWSDVIKLVPLEKSINDNGFSVTILGEPREIYANKKSVRSQEFYLAKQSGIELSFMFEVRSTDYDGEERVVFNEKPHDVERTYEKGEFVELICRRIGDDHEV